MLFHRPSRTLVTSDLLYNYQPEHGTGEKAMFRLIGCYGAPKVAFYHRFALREKAGVTELVEAAAEVFAEAWRPFA